MKAFTILLFTLSISSLIHSSDITFIDITPTTQTSLELKEDSIDQFYVLTCDKLNDSDTLLDFYKSQVDIAIVKIYIYKDQQAALDDYGKYLTFNWTNKVSSQNFKMHFKEEQQGKTISKLYIIFHCIGCKGGVTFNNVFQMTNEMVQVHNVNVNEEITLTKLYSQKYFQIKTAKRENSGIRFTIDPMTKQQKLKIKTYLITTEGELLLDILEVTKLIEIPRTEEYKSNSQYVIRIITDADDNNFKLRVRCDFFIQPTLIEIGKATPIDFSVKHDLYFYYRVNEFNTYEESSLIISLNQNDVGNNPITPVVYSNVVHASSTVEDYEKYVPKTKEQSIFPIVKKDDTHYVLYFKKVQDENTVLFINILFMSETTKGSINASKQSQEINLFNYNALTALEVKLEDKIPYRLTFSCLPSQKNMLIYSPNRNSQTIYVGSILNRDMTVNANTIDIELYGLIYDNWDIITIELYGIQGSYYIHIEPIAFPMYYLYNKRSNEHSYYKLDDIGKTYYFIEATNKGNEDSNLVIKEEYGKFEFSFSNKIDVTKGTLLPNESKSVIFESLKGHNYSLIGVKVISPGNIEMLIQSMSSTTIEFNDFNKYNQLLAKGSSYTINLPKTNKVYNIEISTLVIEDPKAQIAINIDGTQSILKPNSKLLVKDKESKTITIKDLISNSALVFKLISLTSPFTEITNETKTITKPNTILKLINDNIAKYEIRIGKTLKFAYEIGIGETDFIIPPINQVSCISNILCLSFTNPKTKYGQIPKDNYYYLTMSFKEQELPLPIEITTQSLPNYPQLPINTLTSITSETKSSLIKSEDYDSTQSKDLFLLSSPCSVNHIQSITITDEHRTNIKSFSVSNKLNHITIPNLHIPLYLEYIDEEKTLKGFSSYFNYNYLTKTEIESIEKIISNKNYDITYKDYKITWPKPNTNSKLEYLVYVMEEGKNTSAMDNECYLSTLTGKKTIETQFEFNSNDYKDNSTYVIGLRAINTEVITLSITYNPITISIKDETSLTWLWICLSAVIVTGLIIVFVIVYGKKNKNEVKPEGLIPSELSS